MNFEESLILVVERQVPGELITNVKKIQDFVKERVKDFSIDKYVGGEEAAKKDRAVLNNAVKQLDSKRIELEKAFNAPLEEFKALMKETTGIIKDASSKLDALVKEYEEKEKAEKKSEIELYFQGLNFSLVSLDRIFESTWLNKTVKIKTAKEALSEKVKKIYADIELIERIGADSEEVKAFYLDTLDIGQALAKGDQLKANRERLEKEKAEREARKHEEKIEEQKIELRKDVEHELKAEKAQSLAAEALEIKVDPIIEYTLCFRGTRAQLFALRRYMTELGIEYKKIEGWHNV